MKKNVIWAGTSVQFCPGVSKVINTESIQYVFTVCWGQSNIVPFKHLIMLLIYCFTGQNSTFGAITSSVGTLPDTYLFVFLFLLLVLHDLLFVWIKNKLYAFSLYFQHKQSTNYRAPDCDQMVAFATKFACVTSMATTTSWSNIHPIRLALNYHLFFNRTMVIECSARWPGFHSHLIWFGLRWTTEWRQKGKRLTSLETLSRLLENHFRCP